MDILIGVVFGLWILITIGSVIVMATEVHDSNISSNLKFSIHLYLLMGLFFVVEALMKLGFLFVDKF